jgi:isopentenyl-diphosphate Delta-isomerase
MGTAMPDLILVDGSDRQVGTCGALDCHSGEGILHRAFTIFVYNQRGEVLIQRRSAAKRLWPSTWETSCSGHPLPGEDMAAAAEKRLREELGIVALLEDVGRFTYHARYGREGSENEVCHLLVGSYDGPVIPDPAEVLEFSWVDIAALRVEIAEHGEAYAPWVSPALDVLGKFWGQTP